MGIRKSDLPPAFVARMQAQLGQEFEQLAEALEGPRVTSVRLNSKKPSARFADAPPVPWCPEGRYLAERPMFAKDPLIFAGAYYVQEASSMFLAHAFRNFTDPHKPLRVLDLCAAPGGKSTLIASLLPPGSLLVSNELVSKRVPALVENLTRWGTHQAIVSSNSAEVLGELRGYFDVIVIDAPCSGEGMFRKDLNAAQQWSETLVNGCAVQQRQILDAIIPALREGGWIFYSTCTYAPQENEENVAWMVNEHGLASARLHTEPEWNIKEQVVSTSRGQGFGYRFYPHHIQGEGFFFAALQQINGVGPARLRGTKREFKLEELPKKFRGGLTPWLEVPEKFTFMLRGDEVHAVEGLMASDGQALISLLHARMMGINMGRFNKQQLIPSHQLAVSQARAHALPTLPLNWEQAISYLQKKDLTADATGLEGWALASYEGHALGWLKALPNRINNFYPSEWKLRMEIDLEEGM